MPHLQYGNIHNTYLTRFYENQGKWYRQIERLAECVPRGKEHFWLLFIIIISNIFVMQNESVIGALLHKITDY